MRHHLKYNVIVIQDTNITCTSTIIPVWVSTTSEPESEVLVYALLDTQSNTIFILEETAETLNTTMLLGKNNAAISTRITFSMFV